MSIFTTRHARLGGSPSLITLTLSTALAFTSGARAQNKDATPQAAEAAPVVASTPVEPTAPDPNASFFEKARFLYPFATLIRAPKADAHISELSWQGTVTRLRTDDATTEEVPFFIEFIGTYNRADWSLLVKVAGQEGTTPVARNATGDFKIRVPMDHDTVGVELLAVGPMGEIEKEKIAAFYQNLEGLNLFRKTQKEKAEAAANAPKIDARPRVSVNSKNPPLSVGSGLVFSSLTQSFSARISALLIGLRASATYELIADKLDFGFDLKTAMPLKVLSGQESARYSNVGGRIGYQLPSELSSKWRWRVDAGTYYDTMSVKADSYGYAGLIGFELMPQARRGFKSGALDLHMKFAMSLNDFPNSLGSGEYTLGGRWHFLTPQGLSAWSFSSDVSILTLKVGSVDIVSTTGFVGLQYDFR